MPKHTNKKLEIRRLTGMSQQEAAAMLGISREALALYETGKRPSLPGSATLFHALLMLEMNKAIEPPATDAPALSETARQQLRKKLEWIVKESRFQAMKLQRQIEQYTLQQSQQQNRLRVLPCVEKVHTQLLAQSSGTPWKPVSTHQQKWLEMVKDFPDFNRPDEKLEVELALLRLRHQMLLREAEEVERMLGEMG